MNSIKTAIETRSNNNHGTLTIEKVEFYGTTYRVTNGRRYFGTKGRDGYKNLSHARKIADES